MASHPHTRESWWDSPPFTKLQIDEFDEMKYTQALQQIQAESRPDIADMTPAQSQKLSDELDQHIKDKVNATEVRVMEHVLGVKRRKRTASSIR